MSLSTGIPDSMWKCFACTCSTSSRSDTGLPAMRSAVMLMSFGMLHLPIDSRSSLPSSTATPFATFFMLPTTGLLMMTNRNVSSS